MPLNINDNDELPEEMENIPSPMLHVPEKRPPMFTTQTLLILLVAILAAGIFLLYRYSVANFGIFASKPSEENVQTPTLANPWNNAPPKTEAAPPVVELGNQPTADKGQFAVIIQSFRQKSDAEEEAGRWMAAGFPSFVSDAMGWHRVAFGRYESLEEAHRDAQKWKEGFENGYWIARAD